MLDEWVERKIDELCVSIPAYMRPKLIRMRNHGFFWRVYLILEKPLKRLEEINARVNQQKEIAERRERADALTDELEKNGAQWSAEQRRQVNEEIQRLLGEIQRLKRKRDRQVRKEDAASRAEADKRGKELTDAVSRRVSAVSHAFHAFGDASESIVFCVSLFLAMLAALGALMPGSGTAAMAAGMMLVWLGACMNADYEPVCAGVRQRYLYGMLLRMAGLAVFLLYFLARYVAQGIVTNIVLQGAMLVVLLVHMAMFVACVALNRRQMLILRMLSLVLGCIPALLLAAAFALATARLAQSGTTGAVLAAMGAGLVFIGEELTMVCDLGGIRLNYGRGWRCAFAILGYALLLGGAWRIG